MSLGPSLQLLDGFRATRSAMRELQDDVDFALWLELRPRLVADPLDGCLYLAADDGPPWEELLGLDTVDPLSPVDL